MVNHYFQIGGGGMKQASQLSVEEILLDHRGHETKIMWMQVHRKRQRLLVTLHTQHSKPTVAECHRVVLSSGETIFAKDMKKGVAVLVGPSAVVEKLQKVS